MDEAARRFARSGLSVGEVEDMQGRIEDMEDALRKVLDHDLDDPRFHAGDDLRLVIQSMRACAREGLRKSPTEQ